MARITLHRTVDASVETAWAVLRDHALYAEAAPNLATVEVVSGEGDGMVRRCVDVDGNEWTETCTRWEPGRGYAVSVDVADSDFHGRLFERFEGEWRVTERTDGVRLTIQFDFQPKYGPFGRLISWFFEYKAPGVVEPIFDSWEDEMETQDDTEVADSAAEADDHFDDSTDRDRRTNALYR